MLPLSKLCLLLGALLAAQGVEGVQPGLHSYPTLLPYCYDVVRSIGSLEAKELRQRMQHISVSRYEESLKIWAAYSDGTHSQEHAVPLEWQKEETQLHMYAQSLNMTPADLDCLLPRRFTQPPYYMERGASGSLEPVEVSFMVQYFKRPWQIQNLVDATITCQKVVSCEMLVNVDHPQDAVAWGEQAFRTNGFVIPIISNDIHEARAYNRLSQVARGKILIILQDDELLPKDPSWLLHVVGHFNRWPHLGIIGLKTYRINNNRDRQQDIGGRDMYFKDKTTGVPFQFVMLSDYAPMAIRKAAYRFMGGIDETMSEPGECGIYSDFELTMRAWMAGWQVAYHRLPEHLLHDHDHTGGTHTPENEHRCWVKQMELGSTLFSKRWSNEIQQWLSRHIRDLNLQLLDQLDPSKCPFGATAGGC